MEAPRLTSDLVDRTKRCLLLFDKLLELWLKRKEHDGSYLTTSLRSFRTRFSIWTVPLDRIGGVGEMVSEKRNPLYAGLLLQRVEENLQICR
jgi:hypothetical protein